MDHLPALRLFVLLVALGATPAFAAQAEPLEPPPSRFSLLEIRLGAMGVVQSETNYTVTGFVAWVPKVRLFDESYLRASVGAAPLRNSNNSNQNYWLTEAQLFVGFPIDNGMLELGGGIQNWSGGNGGTRAVAGGNILWPLQDLDIDLLDHFFLGYCVYFSTPYTSHEIRVGVGVAF